MKIAVIGTGNVGGTLGTRWSAVGHDVVFGVRATGTQKVKSLLKLTDNKARAADVFGAAAEAEVVVLATPWEAVRDVLDAAGDLKGKIVVDCTNPVAEGLDGPAAGPAASAAERIAEWAAGAHVVKAFNTTGSNIMANPSFGDHRATMFICGDDEESKGVVSQLASDLGFDVCDVGRLPTARYLEPLAMLWIHLAYVRGFGRGFAFALLRR